MLDFVQIGIIAYRNPQTGEYSPSMPIYKPHTADIAKAIEKRQAAFDRLLADEYINSLANKKSN